MTNYLKTNEHSNRNHQPREWHQQKNIKLSAEVIDYLSEQLKIYWSPQQIMERLALDENIKISAETAQTANDAIARLLTPIKHWVKTQPL